MQSSDTTKNAILDSVRYHFARQGSNGIGMRTIARNASISPSVLYHYFPDKESLLEAMYQREVSELGQERKQALIYQKSFIATLNKLIEFQFQHIESITAILKYYFSHRSQFVNSELGYLPPQSTKHVFEILEQASLKHQIYSTDTAADAHVLTHTINGYLLEYFPNVPTPSQLSAIKSEICRFAYRSLRPTSVSINSQGGL